MHESRRPYLAGAPSTEGVGVTFELTPEDWVEVSLDHGSRSDLVRDQLRIVRRLLVAVLGLLALLFYLEGSALLSLVFLIAAPVGLATMGPAVRRQQRMQVRRLAQRGIANGLFGRHAVTLLPEGMLDATDDYEHLTRWHAIERVEEGTGAFLIYTGPDALLPIPHTAFHDAAGLRRFSDAFFALRAAAGARRLPAAEAAARAVPAPTRG